MNEDKVRNEGINANYNYYLSGKMVSNCLLFILTALPYHGLWALWFWSGRRYWETTSMVIWLVAWICFVFVHAAVGLISVLFVDKIILYSHGARKKHLFMEEEKYLIDIFNETTHNVTREYNKVDPEARRVLSKRPPSTERSSEIPINKNPFYIIDEIDINAFATMYGVAINKGAIKTLSTDALQGIMAHELGHMRSNFIFFIRFLQGFLFFGTLLVTVYKYIRKYTGTIINDGDKEYLIQSSNVIITILDFIFLIPTYYFKLISSKAFRWNELYADYIAVLSGYGEGLKSALSVIYQFELLRKLSLMDRLMLTHPPTAIRIVEIERLLNTGYYQAAP